MSNQLKNAILGHPFFLGMKPEHLEVILHNATEITVKPEEIVFRAGDPASRFYLIQSGKIALESHDHGKPFLLQHLGAGDALGWSWLFPPFAWHLQARAVEPTKMIVLDGGHLLVAAEADNQFGYQLMKRTSQILIQRLQKNRDQFLALKQ